MFVRFFQIKESIYGFRVAEHSVLNFNFGHTQSVFHILSQPFVLFEELLILLRLFHGETAAITVTYQTYEERAGTNDLIQTSLDNFSLQSSFFSNTPSQVKRHDGNVSLSGDLCQPGKYFRYKKITLFLHVGKSGRNKDSNYTVFQIVRNGYLSAHK